MKRNICILMFVILCFFSFLPVTAYAETYDLGNTDMSIQVDDTSWYVFTRENINHNSELEELGISYDAMYDILHDNEAYMDAILLYENGEYVELFIRKRALDTNVANLSNYNNDEVLEVAAALAKKQGTNKYSVYENQYKFAKLEYLDSNLGYYICEFVTIVNKDNYTITFQSPSQFTDWEYDEIEKILDSVSFNIDTSITEPKTTSIFSGVVEKSIIGAISGGILGAVVVGISYIKKKRNSEND